MKILIFSYLYPNDMKPSKGIFVAERVQFLKEFCDIKVVAPVPFFPNISFFKRWNKYANIPKFEIRNGIEVYHPKFLLFPKNILRNTIGKFLYFTTINCIKKIYTKWQFDLIHAHFIHPSGIAAAMIGNKINMPIIITEHFGKINEDLLNRGMKRNIRKVYNNISRLIVVSERLKNNLTEAGFTGEKISVIPNGIDLKKFPKISVKQITDQVKIISIGHLIENKGYQFLIHAISILKKSDININLTIIGEGDYRTTLEKMIIQLKLSGSITLLGYIPHSKINNLLIDSHFYIHPSLSESFSIAVIEAMACGLPVIVTQCGGPEYFVNDEVGLVIEKESSEQIAQAIERIINNYSKYDPNSIRKYCIKNFDYNKITKQVFQVYQSVLKEKKNV